MLLADHLLALVLVVIGPIRSGTGGMRRLRVATAESLPRVRVSVYKTAILVQWALAVAVLGLWAWAGRMLRDLGLAPRLTGGLIGVLIGAAVAIAYIVRQRHGLLRKPEGLAEVRSRLAHLERMLPHSREEFGAFARLALTAGVCEELLYRGYLTWYLSHMMPWVAAAGASALAFGIGHAYQGPKGIAQTTIVGAFFAAVYFLSGSLFVPIAIHALMDLHSGHLAWRAFEAERAERAFDEREEEVADDEGMPRPPEASLEPGSDG